ncbi:hypothetical protein C0995_008606 [Termitomyces sp. Mi166|nr:hypothetical protein C0995_008606 [Termitomyces sp. Mi166\
MEHNNRASNFMEHNPHHNALHLHGDDDDNNLATPVGQHEKHPQSLSNSDAKSPQQKNTQSSLQKVSLHANIKLTAPPTLADFADPIVQALLTDAMHQFEIKHHGVHIHGELLDPAHAKVKVIFGFQKNKPQLQQTSRKMLFSCALKSSGTVLKGPQPRLIGEAEEHAQKELEGHTDETDSELNDDGNTYGGTDVTVH